MLNNDERRALIDIEVSLASDPEFTRRFRATEATLQSPRWRSEVSMWQGILVVVGVCAMVASMLSHDLPLMILAIAAAGAGLWPFSGTTRGESTIPHGS
jgi:hypothetical protein